ncbi:MAG TPA: hypothetical protein VM580_29720 [Labilithrix sp.]|jgi:hypothetical protein|nr:hypothetical protein [Labilithrix sp.]
MSSAKERGRLKDLEESPLVTHLAAEQVEHLEAEGATVNKRPDGTALVTTFVAGGVEMTGRTK